MILQLLLAGLITTPPLVEVRASDPAPLASLQLLDLQGRSRPLRERPNEVTLINFWATWCTPCLKELPELETLDRNLRGLEGRVVGIAIDSGRLNDVRQFARDHGMTYTILSAGQAWARNHFQVRGLPVTLVVDRAGRIRHRLVGPHTREQFEAAVRPFL